MRRIEVVDIVLSGVLFCALQSLPNVGFYLFMFALSAIQMRKRVNR